MRCKRTVMSARAIRVGRALGRPQREWSKPQAFDTAHPGGLPHLSLIQQREGLEPPPSEPRLGRLRTKVSNTLILLLKKPKSSPHPKAGR